MGKFKKYSLQQKRKLFDGQCYFCGEGTYEALEAHRVVFGCNEGKYVWDNVLTLCANCHNLIHAGKINILGIHPSTYKERVVHYIDENGKEQWK